MSKERNESPPPDLQRPRYGVDAPAVPAVLGAAGMACCLAATRWRPARIATAATGAVLLASAGVYLHTTLCGKLRIWERELDRAGLQGNEQLLDLGCGRGAVLITAARRQCSGRGRLRGEPGAWSVSAIRTEPCYYLQVCGLGCSALEGSGDEAAHVEAL